MWWSLVERSKRRFGYPLHEDPREGADEADEFQGDTGRLRRLRSVDGSWEGSVKRVRTRTLNRATRGGGERGRRFNILFPSARPPVRVERGGASSVPCINLLRGWESRTLSKNKGPRLPYVPGLDGLRALAVIAVLLYHAGMSWIPGGFLGVEVFFVISGYLITSLLLAEYRERGRIDLKAFWLGRARRLLPALYLVLIVTLVFTVLFLPEEVAGLRSDVLAAFGYVTNWYLVFAQESYFEAVGRPSLLKHLWSLAVEEQFYLLWPILFTAGMALLRRRVLLAVVAGAVASTMLMVILYQPGVDPSRIYYGSDTRAAGLLIGAALAFLLAPGRARRRWTLVLLPDVLGLAALAALVYFCLNFGEFDPFLYQGGLALVSLVTAVLIAAIVQPYGYMSGWILGSQPLRWVGLRSYGIYLWHWPVFVVTRPQLDVSIDGVPLLAARLVLTVALAELSYRYVETPIRRGALGQAWKNLRRARRGRRRMLIGRWAGLAGTGLAFCVVLGVTVAQARPPVPPSYLSSMKAVHTEVTDARPENAGKVNSVKALSEDKKATEGTGATASTVEAGMAKAGAEKPVGRSETTVMERQKDSAAKPDLRPSPASPVTAVGDSVMLGAAGALRQEIANLGTIDAQVGLQASAAIEILRVRRAAGQLGDVVVVHLGNNGTFTSAQFDEMMGVLDGVSRVVVVNNKVPRPWEQSNDAVLAEGVSRYPNAVLVDWYGASVARPELFWEDGIHLRPEGARVYVDLVAANLVAG